MDTYTPEQYRNRIVQRLIAQARDDLGRAHWNRMRVGMHPDCILPQWEELTERTREAYRAKLDYLLPVISGVVAGLAVQAYDHQCVERTLADLS